ncbi:MAG TPA: hypothetical protein VGD17_12815 [Chitinophagaceae bacterium]
MEAKSTILKELQEISPAVAAIGSHLPYRVPQGYFEGLAGSILDRIRAGSLNSREELETISPLLSGLSRKTPYEVPSDYFADLTENVVGGVKAIDFVQDELQTLSPMMEGLKRTNVYNVPSGYFDSLPVKILNKVQERQPAKVISMNTRRFTRYAAAAILTGALAIGGWFYLNRSANTEQTVAGIEKISDDNKVSDEEMSSFIENETLPLVVSTSSVNEDIDESDVKEMLAEVSEDELQQFLITL